MVVEFFKSSMTSDFIKNLMSKTPIPIHSFIDVGNIIYEGHLYMYKDKLIRCLTTGVFMSPTAESHTFEYLICSDEIICSPDRICSDIPVVKDVVTIAEYVEVSRYKTDSVVPGVSSFYQFNNNEYDYQTHLALGEYLRLLKNIHNIDLMSLYNCFSFKTLPNDKNSNGMLTYLVPIKLDKKYTLSMSCGSPVRVYPVLVDNDMIMEDTYYLGGETSFSSLTYSSPKLIQFTIKDVESHYSKVHRVEKCLYMAIEVPNSFDGPISVLEGDYTQLSKLNIIDVNMFDNNTLYDINKLCTYNPILLSGQSQKVLPFSPKLLYYLIRNTIDNRDEIFENIENIQNKIDGDSSDSDGVWSDRLRYKIYNRYTKKFSDDYDILGFVDTQTERAIMRGEI